MTIDYDSYKYIKNYIKKVVDRLKDSAVHSVDKMEDLMSIRGQIRGLESLLQDLTDLQKKQELFDDDKDGDEFGSTSA
jgi:predicted component of type VI protein secretion system